MAGMPMQPPQGPQGPQGAPAPQQEPGPQQEQGPSSEIGKMISNVGKGLSMLTQIMSQVPDTPPGLAEEMGKVTEHFQSVISALSGGGEDGPPQQGARPADQGMTTQEAGARGPTRPAM